MGPWIAERLYSTHWRKLSAREKRARYAFWTEMLKRSSLMENRRLDATVNRDLAVDVAEVLYPSQRRILFAELLGKKTAPMFAYKEAPLLWYLRRIELPELDFQAAAVSVASFAAGGARRLLSAADPLGAEILSEAAGRYLAGQADAKLVESPMAKAVVKSAICAKSAEKIAGDVPAEVLKRWNLARMARDCFTLEQDRAARSKLANATGSQV